ncbi:MAG: hypothetical protein ACK44W_15550 [Planctomycetota bacterium]
MKRRMALWVLAGAAAGAAPGHDSVVWVVSRLNSRAVTGGV